MDEEHEKPSTDDETREIFETWAACHGEDTIVLKETSPIVDELHDMSIAQMRSDLANFNWDVEESHGSVWEGPDRSFRGRSTSA